MGWNVTNQRVEMGGGSIINWFGNPLNEYIFFEPAIQSLATRETSMRLRHIAAVESIGCPFMPEE
jgi:hypothetical protein